MEDCKDFTLHLICVTKFVLDKLQRVPLKAHAFHHLSENILFSAKKQMRTKEAGEKIFRAYFRFSIFNLSRALGNVNCYMIFFRT